MKRVLACLLAGILLLCLAGCGGNGGETNAGSAKDYSSMKVVALLAGPMSDNGWNQTGYMAVKHLEEKYGVQADYVEAIAVSDMEEYIRMYGDEGYDMIVIHGAQFVDKLLACADDYPDTAFCLSYGDTDLSEGKPNVLCVGPVNMGIMVGAIMGILTDTNKVCWLAGQDIPAITNVTVDIEEGVHLTNPDAEVYIDVIGTLTDADLAREKASAFIDQGIDVISASANSAQLGVLQAAEQKGIYAVGFNGDQYTIAPEAIVLSVLRNYNAIYEDVFLSVADGTFAGGRKVINFQEGGTLVSDWHGWDKKLPQEKVDKINETVEKLLNGELGDY